MNKCENKENSNTTDNNTNNSNQVVIIDSSKNDVTEDWKTYTNEKYGFTFQYPNTWTKYGEESNAINPKGEVMAIKVNFIDTISQSIFYLEYHLAPYGAELYKSTQAEFNSKHGPYEKDAKQIIVAGNNALESFSTMSSDFKGNIYNPPLRFVHITFLDKLQSGDFDLNFKTLLPVNEIEIAKFNLLLSTFKFIN